MKILGLISMLLLVSDLPDLPPGKPGDFYPLQIVYCLKDKCETLVSVKQVGKEYQVTLSEDPKNPKFWAKVAYTIRPMPSSCVPIPDGSIQKL